VVSVGGLVVVLGAFFFGDSRGFLGDFGDLGDLAFFGDSLFLGDLVDFAALAFLGEVACLLGLDVVVFLGEVEAFLVAGFLLVDFLGDLALVVVFFGDLTAVVDDFFELDVDLLGDDLT